MDHLTLWCAFQLNSIISQSVLQVTVPFLCISTSRDHFTVVCLVAWPLYESEAGVDLVSIETSLTFVCKFLLISMRTASLT